MALCQVGRAAARAFAATPDPQGRARHGTVRRSWLLSVWYGSRWWCFFLGDVLGGQGRATVPSHVIHKCMGTGWVLLPQEMLNKLLKQTLPYVEIAELRYAKGAPPPVLVLWARGLPQGTALC